MNPECFHRSPYGEALACCNSCPVAEACLFSALVDEDRAPQRHGVWGATTPPQRETVRVELHRRALDPLDLLALEEAHWAGVLATRLSSPPHGQHPGVAA